MINYKNIVRYERTDFKDYLGFPGFSHSFLKREVNGINPGIEITDNMKLGSMVDAFLTEPEKVDFNSPFYEPGRDVALKITEMLGAEMIQRFEKQVSFTADAESEGWTMPVKGRIDWGLRKIAVLDVKFTRDTHPKNIYNLIDFMGYDNQLWSYSRFYQVNKAYIVVHFYKYKTTKIIPIDVTKENLFWKDKIQKFGRPIAA